MRRRRRGPLGSRRFSGRASYRTTAKGTALTSATPMDRSERLSHSPPFRRRPPRSRGGLAVGRQPRSLVALVPEVSAVSHHGCLILQGGNPFRDCCCSFMADLAIRGIGPVQGLIQRCTASAVSAGAMLNVILAPGASM